MQFQVVKNGYNKEEVDKQVDSLTSELQVWKDRALKAETEYIKIKEKENDIKKNGENVALALTAAIEKAKQIETSSKNVYKLKIQQLSILYDRWETMLNELLAKNPSLEDSHNIQKLIAGFKRTIENVVSQDYETSYNGKNSNNDTMRQLLTKMSNYSKSEDKKNFAKIERNVLPRDLKTGQTELNRMEEKVMIKPITDLTLDKNERYETLVDKFLKEDFEQNPQYTNFMSKKLDNTDYPMPNESGFNLKEAVNPKDDLDEIMKCFDFFNDESKK